MSEENVEIVLGTFRHFKPDGLKEWVVRWHPECSATPNEGWPEQGPFVGRDAIMRQFERLFADLSEYHFDDMEVIAESGDWVVVKWRWRIRGAASGIEMQLDQATAFRVEDGMVMEAHFRTDVADAFEAAGLSE